jgi:hypothetical protein
MVNEYKTIKCKLDGKQSVSIPIDIKKNGRYVTEPLDVIVRGFIKFSDSTSVIEEGNGSNSLFDKTVVYPVLFTSPTTRITNGRCIITLTPRSEDLFEETASVIESANISDENIIEGGIQADEQIIDPDKNPVVIRINTGEIRTPYKVSIEVTVLSVNSTNFHITTVDRGTNPQVESSSSITSLFQKEKARIPSNIIVDFYNDDDWLPVVDDVLGSNNSDIQSMINALNDLENSTPFGISPMYDGIIASSRILSDKTVNDKKKTIYVFTDNEANISKTSIDEVLEEVNDIDGDKKVPVLAANLSIVSPTTLSVKANISDTKNINKLSFLTGGQAITIVDDNYIDDIVGIFFREAVGSMGYGTYEFIVDIGEESLINQITGFFDIPFLDSSGSWSIETSIDGYNFTEIQETYDYSETAIFEELRARYIKFKIILITSISEEVDEYGSYPESPSLLSMRILYNAYKISYLYLNKIEADIQPYQMTLAVDANEINDDQIYVGLAKSDAHNWEDFYTESQPPVKQNGKVIVPLRFSQDTTEFQQEPLAKIDAFTLKTEYGRFDSFSSVILYDKTDEIIPTNYYKLQPDNGIIIFNYALPSNYVDGDYKIGIINGKDYKVGMKLTNKTNNEGLEIYGVGYLYTTGKDLLPPLAKSAPEAQLVQIVGDVINRFTKIEANYIYYDENFEPEDKTLRTIKWFINGAPVSYLDNLLVWNDIENPSDPVYVNTSLQYPDSLDEGETLEEWAKKQSSSILHAGDKVHFEIRVSDGSLNSNSVKSNVVEISESEPLIGTIKLMLEYNGNLYSRISANGNIIIYPSLDEVFYADGGVNQSEIIWYVNNEIFKRGIYGEEVPEGTSSPEQLSPGDPATGDYQDYPMQIANEIFVEVIPKSGDQVGEAIRSPVVVVQNALPEVGNVAYVNSVYRENNNIILTWDFFDYEIMFLKDIDSTNQFDQTSVKWYRKKAGETVWPEDPVYIYNDIDNSLREVFNEEDYRGHFTTSLPSSNGVGGSSIIDNSIIHVGQQWYAEIIPHDSVDAGSIYTTPVITITS